MDNSPGECNPRSLIRHISLYRTELHISDPSFQVGNAPLAIRLWGITWVGFNIFALVIILNNFRKRERWA